jgi:Flp pilus assembly protein TadD
VALADLAWLLAARRAGGNGREGEAVELARKATELTGSTEPVMLDVLAVAYAAAGRFDEAMVTAEKALGLARATSPDLASAIQQRLELFRQRRPYRVP